MVVMAAVHATTTTTVAAAVVEQVQIHLMVREVQGRVYLLQQVSHVAAGQDRVGVVRQAKVRVGAGTRGAAKGEVVLLVLMVGSAVRMDVATPTMPGLLTDPVRVAVVAAATTTATLGGRCREDGCWGEHLLKLLAYLGKLLEERARVAAASQ